MVFRCELVKRLVHLEFLRGKGETMSLGTPGSKVLKKKKKNDFH